MSEKFDCAVIGTGPAGVSAAITLKIRGKNIVLFGSKNLSEKLLKAKVIKNYPGFPLISGSELRDKFLEHLESLQIQITEENIVSIYNMGSYFSILTKENKIYESLSVIIASGVNFKNPYPNEEKFLGHGLSYCATCDGPLFKGKTIAVIAENEGEESEAEFLSDFAEKIYYIPLYKKESFDFSPKIEVIFDEPLSIDGEKNVSSLKLKNHEISVQGIFILRSSISPSQLISSIELEENHIKVDRNMKTNIEGVFASGDITGKPYQYAKACGEGNVAALSVVSYLSNIE